MLRIIIADDHDVVRRGLRDQLASRDGWEVAAKPTTAAQQSSWLWN
jgi:DNA-binding NarL/FixJ family response regulator